MNIKGYHGFVVLPGSRHANGTLYEWQAGCRPSQVVSLAEMPAWLIQELGLKRPRDNQALFTAAKTASRSGHAWNAFRTPLHESLDKERLRGQFGIDVNDFAIRLDAQPKEWRLDKLLYSGKKNHERIMDTWNVKRGPGSRFAFFYYGGTDYEVPRYSGGFREMAVTGNC